MVSADVEAYFARMADVGIEFGPRFRGLRQASFGHHLAEGQIGLGITDETGDADYFFPPELLDACFHVCAIAAESIPEASKTQMYLPIGADRYSWYRRPGGPLRSRAFCREISPKGDMVVFDIRIETDAGEQVALVEGLRCRTATRASIRARAGGRMADWLYSLAWHTEPSRRHSNEPSPADWLLLDDGTGYGARLADEIRLRGARVAIVPAPKHADGDDPAGFGSLADRIGDAVSAAAGMGIGYGVVCLWPLLVPSADSRRPPGQLQEFGTHAVIALLRSLGSADGTPPSRLWFITRGAQAVDGSELVSVAQAPVVGIGRVAASERPDLRVGLFDLDPQGHVGDVARLAEELLGGGLEREVALRKGTRWVPRLGRHALDAARTAGAPSVRLVIRERGTLENLSTEEFEPKSPGADEIQIRVRASGVNFRDVLGALGLYPGELQALGSDCAGEIVALGSNVRGFEVGDRVVAMVSGAFASYATTPWEFVAPLPRDADFEQGAAIPSAYLTAAITLELVAGITAEHQILIHSGAGGVGMAAIAMARRVGSTIFATAGSDEKREALRLLGVHHVLDSRSPGFADELLRITGGKGVDIVLNSLAGEMLDRSFDCVANGGTFLEIGKRGVWSHERVEALGRGIKYHVIDCNDYAAETPQLVGQVFARVLNDIDAGRLPWLPCTTFAFERAADAFRYMAQARHIGRVVLRHGGASRNTGHAIRPDATYVVTGGLKGLGFATASWLADQGARHLLLVARSIVDETAAAEIHRMRSCGVQVETLAADVSTQAGVEAIFAMFATELPPLGGIVHCAAVLDDGILANQTNARLDAVMGPKADAAWRLHVKLEELACRPDFFVMFSSLSTVFGSAGQGNYVAANACLDALAHYRRSLGLAATSIGWGAWGEIGMATRSDVISRASTRGVGVIAPDDGLEILRQVLCDGANYVAVAPIDWGVIARQFGADPIPPVLQRLVRAASPMSPEERVVPRAAATQFLDALDSADRLRQLTKIVRAELGTVLALGGAAASIAEDQTFTSLGLDSLTAMELRNRLQAKLGRPVAATAAFAWPTIAELACHLNSTFEHPVVADDESSDGREEIDL